MRTILSIVFISLLTTACAEEEGTEPTDTGSEASSTSTYTGTTTETGTPSSYTATETSTGTGAGTGTGTGSGTGTSTGTTPTVTNDGTYIGTLDITFTFTQGMIGRVFESYCQIPITVVVDETATPQISAVEVCDLSRIGLSATTELVFEGTMVGTNGAEGTMAIDDVVAFSGEWTTAGFYSGNTFTATIDGVENGFVGGPIEWTGGWTAIK